MKMKDLLRQAALGTVLGLVAGWALWATMLRKPPHDVMLVVKAAGQEPMLHRLATGDPAEQLLALLREAIAPLFAAAPGATNETALGEYNATVVVKGEGAGELRMGDGGDFRLVWRRLGDPPTEVVEFRRKVPGRGWPSTKDFLPAQPAPELVRRTAERVLGEIRSVHRSLAGDLPGQALNAPDRSSGAPGALPPR